MSSVADYLTTLDVLYNNRHGKNKPNSADVWRAVFCG